MKKNNAIAFILLVAMVGVGYFFSTHHRTATISHGTQGNAPAANAPTAESSNSSTNTSVTFNRDGSISGQSNKSENTLTIDYSSASGMFNPKDVTKVFFDGVEFVVNKKKCTAYCPKLGEHAKTMCVRFVVGDKNYFSEAFTTSKEFFNTRTFKPVVPQAQILFDCTDLKEDEFGIQAIDSGSLITAEYSCNGGKKELTAIEPITENGATRYYAPCTVPAGKDCEMEITLVSEGGVKVTSKTFNVTAPKSGQEIVPLDFNYFYITFKVDYSAVSALRGQKIAKAGYIVDSVDGDKESHKASPRVELDPVQPGVLMCYTPSHTEIGQKFDGIFDIELEKGTNVKSKSVAFTIQDKSNLITITDADF